MRTPFPLPENWSEDPSWQQHVQNAFSPEDARRWLDQLKTIFTPEWIRSQATVGTRHPVIIDNFYIGGRHRLVEVGAAIERFRPRRIRDRLRNADEYLSTCAELRVGLALESLGAALDHEPSARSGAGPDWLASWTGFGTVAAEAKYPHTSENSRGSGRPLLES